MVQVCQMRSTKSFEMSTSRAAAIRWSKSIDAENFVFSSLPT